MAGSGDRVETTARCARWRVENFSANAERRSEPFKIGPWTWVFSMRVDYNGWNHPVQIRLYPTDISSFSKYKPSFNIKVTRFKSGRHTIFYEEVSDRQQQRSNEFQWAFDPSNGLDDKFIIDVEFPDVNVDGDQSNSGGASDHFSAAAAKATLAAFREMLDHGVSTDLTIKGVDCTVSAHRAILSARSPVFRNMFSHDFKEKELATVEISDLSASTCGAFLRFIYGGDVTGDFISERLPLLYMADKYDVDDLRQACEKSLAADIDKGNVLERLQTAHQYKLPLLKKSCMRYLVTFQRIWDLQEEIASFQLTAERELLTEILTEIIAAWKRSKTI